MTEQNSQSNFKNAPKHKKMGFFSAMLIVMGSSIGAGIFFKSEEVLNNSRGNLVLAIICWIIASFSVISMAMAIIEVAGVKNDNLSLIGWNRIFNSRWVHQASKNFMVYLTLPLTFFYMPVYTIMVLQDGLGALANKEALTFGTNNDWLIWLAITTFIGLYFLTIPTLISKIGNIHNIIVLCIKFLPLVFIIIIGIVLAITGKGGTDSVKILEFEKNYNIRTGSSIIHYGGFGGFIGIFLSIGAIFFAYDGFYIAAGMQSEMKNPKKTSLALSLGLIIITVIYLMIAISMSINGGSFSQMRQFIENIMGNKAGRIIFGLINIAIAIGVIGVINGFSMWMPRYIESLLAEGELPFWRLTIKKLNPNRPVIGVIYSLIIGLSANIIFTIIGAKLYLPTNDLYLKYGTDMASVYSFTDLIANWITVFTFVFIALAIIGALRNRKTKKVPISNPKKSFKFFAYCTIIFVSLAMLAQILVPILDFALIFVFDVKQYAIEKNVSYEQAQNFFISLAISRSMLVAVLLIFHFLVFLPIPIFDKYNKHKYGSLEAFEKYKANFIKTNLRKNDA
ncbi:amino acid transporter [Mycoplasmopsis bovigenitalium]|uniref:Amino acid transporter n=1 Tax=Mycoplasmopsis bovigenitalium TaxID=2112 RepID=A0A449A9W7_9BACT|nr:APC family permease [Mycoplasmopsis bovigenitalium]VEU60970.1 amino acid transporter [Mycoplasmopsis bovigenitalium]